MTESNGGQSDAKASGPVEIKVAREVALDDFDRFCEEMAVDNDARLMDAEDWKAFEGNKALIVAQIMRGNLTVDDDGAPTYTVQGKKFRGEKIVFHEPDGNSLLQTGGKGKDQDVKKSFAITAALTDRNIPFYSSLKYRDVKICLAVQNLFLG